MLNTEIITESTESGIERDQALYFSTLQGEGVYDLLFLANRTRTRFRGKKIDLCSIVNAKSGSCPEDCSFCAQSISSKTDADTYPLLKKEKILKAASSARDNKVNHFCIVTSGKKVSVRDLDEICDIISAIKELGLLPCATLGLLDDVSLVNLKEAGLSRYHHNLETSESYFSEICTTHTYQEKIRTISAAKAAGLSICSGGIFGLGESWEDRIDMAFALKEIGVDSVPLNFLTPVTGTPLENKGILNPIEALKIIAIYRLILPLSEIRVCGGREITLRDLNTMIFTAGADGLLVGNYLTTSGRAPDKDLQMIKDMDLEIKCQNKVTTV
jgi:biotin synthase